MEIGFDQSTVDYSLVTHIKGDKVTHLLVYVDDIIITGSNNYGYGLLGCKPSSYQWIEMYTLDSGDSELLKDPTTYKRLVGKLIYLLITRVD